MRYCQYLGRADMWRLSRQLVGRCLYNSKRVEFEGARATVKQVYIGGHEADAGIVTENTKTIFRSESAKFIIFLQMSQEMWDFDKDGELFYEKAVGGFLPDLFERWNQAKVSHVVSIVLFTRLYFPVPPPTPAPSTTAAAQAAAGGVPPLTWDAHGRCYRDFYKVVLDWESRNEWSSVLEALRHECNRYREELFEQFQLPVGPSRFVRPHAIALAADGNFLEATNLALNVFEKVGSHCRKRRVSKRKG